MAAPDDSRLSRLASRTGQQPIEIWHAISAQMVGNLTAKVATRCRAEPGDLCAGMRMTWSADGQPTSGIPNRGCCLPHTYAL